MLSRTEESSKTTSTPSAVWTILLPLVAGLCYSGLSALVKYLKNTQPVQLVLYRCWAVASLTLPQLIYRKENILGPPSYRILLIVQSLSGATAILLHFIAFRLLPLGEASVLISTYPVFVCIVAKIFLKESLNLLMAVSVALTIIGMILVTGVYEEITKGSRVYTISDIYGLVAAITSVAFITVQAVLTRKLIHIHYSVMIFLGGALAMIESGAVLGLTGGFSLNCSDNILILLIGVFGYLALLLNTVALIYMEAGPVSTIRSASDIFFAFLWQVMIFHDIPRSTQIIGAVLVCFSVVLLGFGKQILGIILCSSRKNA